MLQVNGLFDDIVVASIGDAIDRSAEQGSQALVLQVDTPGAVVSDEAMAGLLDRIASAPLPIGVWVGLSGAEMLGTPAQILAVADVTGMAPGAKVGNVGAPVTDRYDLGPGLTALRNRTVGLADARDLGVFKQRISDEGIAGIQNMIDALDGYTENGVEIDTTREQVTESGTVQRQAIAITRLSKLGLVDQLFHTVASPPVAYLLFLIGMALLLFEFFTAGVGVAGVVGAGCTVLACYGSPRCRLDGGRSGCSCSRWSRSRSTCRSGSRGSGRAWASCSRSSGASCCSNRSTARRCGLRG